MVSPWWVVHMLAISQCTKATRQVASAHCPQSPIRRPSMYQINPSFFINVQLVLMPSPFITFAIKSPRALSAFQTSPGLISYQVDNKKHLFDSTVCTSGSRPGPAARKKKQKKHTHTHTTQHHLVVIDEPAAPLAGMFISSSDGRSPCMFKFSADVPKCSSKQQKC